MEGDGGSLRLLPPPARRFLAEALELCGPRSFRLCDGSEGEAREILGVLRDQGTLHPLPKMRNCWLARTDPRDVARVESRTVLVTEREREAVPPKPPGGGPPQLGIWMSPQDFQKAFRERFPGCMAGRTLYAIPFSMGPPSSPLAKVGLQLTDSPYVAASMRIMTRVGPQTFPRLAQGDFVQCLHSVGRPLPLKEPLVNGWPCDPARTLIAHLPDRRRVVSYGSGYGGNSLLGKKCFALRIASRIARDEGWLAEHMLILGVTDPAGTKRYVAAAFPSACGKTNLAMMSAALPGWRVRCVGDDIAWMKFDDQGDPEPCAHPNSRFCAPASQCPIMDPAWEDPQGVPIDAIVFGGRRPQGVPLVYEAFGWRHGVFVGSAMRSEATAAAEHAGRRLMHDPFAMRPFFGYNAGRYLAHWLSFGRRPGLRLPKIFHVNWFLKDQSGRFVWPGFGENSRVLAWICSRVGGEDNAQETPVGLVPREGALDLRGLPGVSYSALFPFSRAFWEKEVQELRSYYEENFGEDLPREVMEELEALERRVKKM